MKLALRFARPYRVWHARLRARLEAEGHGVSLQPIGSTSNRTLALALSIERLLYRSQAVLFARQTEPRRAPDEIPDFVVSLDGRPVAGASLALLFDATPGEVAMLKALLAGRAPHISIIDGAGQWRASGRPAVERPDLLSQSIDHVLAAAINLVTTAVRSAEASRPASSPEPEVKGSSGPLAFVARRLTGKIIDRLRRRRTSDVGWSVAMRLTTPEEPGVAALRAWPEVTFTTLGDEKASYYADPFPFEHEGRRFVFAERYLEAAGKGVIAMFEIDRHGAAAEPRIVLDLPGHVSYPFVFEVEGGIYMLPETSSSRRLQLFRAAPFPDRWLPATILVDDVVASDATPIVHAGRYWIFASLSGDGGSSWDRLGLFHASGLHGPWVAHKKNPVLVDAGAARPAGAMWHEDGVLMRVVQDCRAGYGVGLRICRVDRIDLDGYAQTIVATLPAPEGASAVHTLNRSQTMEVIDLRRSR